MLNVNIIWNKKDKIMQYILFCGKKNAAYFKNAASILVA